MKRSAETVLRQELAEAEKAVQRAHQLVVRAEENVRVATVKLGDAREARDAAAARSERALAALAALLPSEDDPA